MRLLSRHIENFRGIRALDLELEAVTVLIGENNAGKTSVLDALKICLRDLRSRQGSVFEPYDFYLATPNSEPRDAPLIKIVLKFGETTAGEWPETVTAPLARARVFANWRKSGAIVSSLLHGFRKVSPWSEPRGTMVI